jgi:hypothetical protein
MQMLVGNTARIQQKAVQMLANLSCIFMSRGLLSNWSGILWAQMLDRFQRQIVSLSTTRSLPCPHEEEEGETANPVQRVQNVEVRKQFVSSVANSSH